MKPAWEAGKCPQSRPSKKILKFAKRMYADGVRYLRGSRPTDISAAIGGPWGHR